MNVSTTTAEWQQRRRALEPATVGLVPTMGALHDGHASLIKRCRMENDITVVTLFVNPLQFNDPADLLRYPRTLDTDLVLLRKLGVDEVFNPRPGEMYPHGPQFIVTAPKFTTNMEGRHRPGFFEGVMTVVLKLLNLARAHRAYFGEKDYQQWKILHEMAADLFIPTQIIRCTTVRTKTGLAESSRNVLLSPEARKKAALIFKTLTSAASPEDARLVLQSEGFAVDYIEEHWGRRFAAATLEGVRLIDNVALPPIGD